MSSLRRKSYVRVDPKTGERVKRLARKWYGKYRDADGVLYEVPLCSDKAASRMMLNDLVRNSERRKSGLIDPFDDEARKPLPEHFAAFEAHLDAKGNVGRHVRQTMSAVRTICDACGFKRIGDIQASAVSEWIGARRKEGLSRSTANAYLIATKSFCSWLVKDRRAGLNPLVHLSRLNTQVDPRRERRTLSTDEIERLLRATVQGEAFRDLSGSDRRVLYLVALYSGLRASELASLTRESFELDRSPALVVVKAGYSKRKRQDCQPIPAELVPELQGWLSTKAANVRVWPGTWVERAADMLA